jgi:photosystem II stability/assembly factor-like uncharacterized protein
MIPDDPELRRALAARSGEASPDFAARVRASLPAGARPTNWMPAVAAAVVVVLCVTSIGLLVHLRQAQRTGLASGPRLSTPSARPTPEGDLPASVKLDAAGHDVVWAFTPDDQVLFVSTDQGDHWQQRALPPDTGGPASSVSFLDANTGWFLATGSPTTECQQQPVTLWRTDDGARTWRRIAATGISENECKANISFADSTHGFMAAGDELHRPVVYRTLDGGLTWKGVTLQDPRGFKTEGGGFTLRAGAVRSFGTTLLVEATGQSSTSGTAETYAYVSHDGGASWSVQAYVGPATGDLAFLTPTRWLLPSTVDCIQGHVVVSCPGVTVAPGAMRTDDGGRTWEPFVTDYAVAAGVTPAFVFADAEVGYGSVSGALYRTLDGGAHWSLIATPGTTQTSPSPHATPVATPTLRYPMPQGVQLIPAGRQTVWAYLEYSHVLLVSTDLGDHWDVRKLPAGSAGALTDFSFVSADEGWALVSGASTGTCATEQVRIYQTLDGARTWKAIDATGIPDAQCKENLVFVDATHAFMTSEQEDALPRVLHSDDGGSTWSAAQLSDPASFESERDGFAFSAGFVHSFGSTLLVSAAGNAFLSDKAGSYVYRSTDGGAHWAVAATLPAGPGGVVFFSPTHWVIFQPNAIQTFDGGRTWQSFSTDYGDAAGIASTFVFADTQVGYATVRGDFHRTTDGGAHWVMPATAWSAAA